MKDDKDVVLEDVPVGEAGCIIEIEYTSIGIKPIEMTRDGARLSYWNDPP